MRHSRMTIGERFNRALRALSNAGLWFLGRLQTDADRARVLGGLAAARGTEDSVGAELETTLQRLAPRWFVVRNAHSPSPPMIRARGSTLVSRAPPVVVL
jgi:hypothetical protein